jgi:hypothetical protein
MPFLSRSQQRWGNSPSGVKALGGKKKVEEWNDATPPGPSVPERKKPSVIRRAAKRA